MVQVHVCARRTEETIRDDFKLVRPQLGQILWVMVNEGDQPSIDVVGDRGEWKLPIVIYDAFLGWLLVACGLTRHKEFHDSQLPESYRTWWSWRVWSAKHGFGWGETNQPDGREPR